MTDKMMSGKNKCVTVLIFNRSFHCGKRTISKKNYNFIYENNAILCLKYSVEF